MVCQNHQNGNDTEKEKKKAIYNLWKDFIKYSKTFLMAN